MVVSDWSHERRAVLIGHSHSEAIAAAAPALGLELAAVNFWTAPQPAISAEGDALHPEIAATLASGPVIAAVGGAVHAMVGLVQHPQPFDFVLPERPDLPLRAGARLLPLAVMRDVMLAQLGHYHNILRLVRDAAGGPVTQLEPPPPPRDDARVLADVPWMFFPDLTRDVSPARLRWKLWRLESRLTQEFCDEIGIGYLRCPADALDEEGFLRADLYKDAMHVTADYGRLVVRDILAQPGLVA